LYLKPLKKAENLNMKNQSRHNWLETLKSVAIVALIVILTGFIYRASTSSIEDADLKLQELEKKYKKNIQLLDEEQLKNNKLNIKISELQSELGRLKDCIKELEKKRKKLEREVKELESNYRDI
jgi:septal ring factor EnvC (AmiA/AmiB activator)